MRSEPPRSRERGGETPIARVDITFDGSSRGALAAARQTSTGIDGVKKSAREASRDLASTERNLNRTVRGAVAGSGAFKALGRQIAFASGAFLGGAGLVAVLKSSYNAASNLTEQINKSRVTFGVHSKMLEAWAKTTADAFGIASDKALEFTGTFGGILNVSGIVQSESAKMSRELVELAADMASFNNSTPEEALEALRSGLIGEAEPLRRFQVLLSDARVQAEALTSGIAKQKVNLDDVRDAQTKVAIATARLTKAQHDHGVQSVAAAQAGLAVTAAERGLEKALHGKTVQLSEAEKVLARYQVILKDTKIQQGDFGRTADEGANMQRRLNANIRETQISIGNKLKPVILDVMTAMNDWLRSEENQEKVSRAVASGVHGVTEAVKIAVPLIRTAWHVADGIAGALGGWKNAIKLLLALKFASWLTGLAGGFTSLIGTEAAGLTGAELRARKLRFALLRLKAIGVITIAVELLLNKGAVDKAVTGFLRDHGLGAFTGTQVKNWSDWEKLPDWAKDGLLGKGVDPYTLPGAPKRPTASLPVGSAAAAVFPGSPGAGSVPASQIVPIPTRDTHGPRLKSAFQTMGTRNLDFKGQRGTVVGAPEDGYVHHTSGQASPGVATTGGSYGYSIYYIGNSGTIYFMTHFASIFVKGGQRLKRGQALGTVAAHISEDHIHLELAPGGYVLPGTKGAAGPPDPLPKPDPLPFTENAGRPDIAKVPEGLRLRIARAESRPGARDDITAYGSLLQVYLKRQQRKGITTGEKADLQEAINTLREKIRSAEKDIADALNEEIRKGNERILKAATAHPDAFASMAATRAGDLVPGIRQIMLAQAKKIAQMVASAKKARGSAMDALGTLLGFDADTQVETQDEWGRVVTTTIGAVAAKVKTAIDLMNDAIAHPTAKTWAAAMNAWKNLATQIGPAIQAGLDAAAARIETAQSALSTAFQRLSSRILSAFDRVTQRELQSMQRSFQQQIDAMQRELDQRIAAMQRALADKVRSLQEAGAALTPEEQALKAFQDARTAEQRAQELADAQAIADPVERAKRLHELELQAQEEALQKAADLSRQARDKEIAAQVEALQEQEAALEQSLRDQLALQIQALQDAQTAREQDYQDQRDAQRQLLTDQLDAWQRNILAGSASFQDFVAWLKGEGASGLLAGAGIPDPVQAMAEAGSAQGSAFAQAYIAELQAAYQAYLQLLALQPPTYTAPVAPSYGSAGGTGQGVGHLGFALGGKVPGRYVGREDTIMARVTPEERVLDREFNRRLEQALFGGGIGGQRPAVVVTGNTFYGTTQRQAERALAEAVRPYTSRVSSYDNPL